MRKFCYFFLLIFILTILSSCETCKKIAKVAIQGAGQSVVSYAFPKIQELTKRIVDSGNAAMKKYEIPLQIRADVESIKQVPDNHQYGLIKKAEYIQVDFYVIPLKSVIFFPLGQYMVDRAYGAPYFIATVKEFIAELQKMDESKKLSLSGEFEGGADMAGFGGIVGTYAGEFGDITENDVLINGQTRNFFLTTGGQISNSDLAFLRAYSVYDFLITLLQDIGLGRQDFISIKFIGNEYERYGKKI